MKSPTMIRDCFFAILLLCVFSSACSKNNRRDDVIDSMKERYEDWLTRHGRRYGKTEEWNLRFGIYQSNVVLIDYINSQNLSYKLTDNEFADMTNFEFQSLFMGYRNPRYSQVRYNSTCDDSEVPTSIDWRKEGAVTPVKNQGTCGSCWAFSTIAAVEGINKIKTGKLISLSEQELVDCNYNEYNQGCDGGYMEKAFEYIKKNDGITTEKNYPYEGKKGDCNVAKEKDHVVTISGHVSVSRSDEKALQVAVAQQPVSVAIDAGGYDFQLYSSGIFSGYCGKELNHGVTVIGYGVETDNKYWLVKNSWGTSWGEEGYIKMKRDSSDKDGECGIALMASYPTKA